MWVEFLPFKVDSWYSTNIQLYSTTIQLNINIFNSTANSTVFQLSFNCLDRVGGYTPNFNFMLFVFYDPMNV